MALPAQAKTVAFILTRDRAVAKAFYGDKLGFPKTSENDFAVVYDMGGAVLRITTIPDHTPSPHPVLGWDAPDIGAAVDALAAKGVVFEIYEGFGQDARGIWSAPDGGAKVAWFKDPDGNLLSVSEHAG